MRMFDYFVDCFNSRQCIRVNWTVWLTFNTGRLFGSLESVAPVRVNNKEVNNHISKSQPKN